MVRDHLHLAPGRTWKKRLSAGRQRTRRSMARRRTADAAFTRRLDRLPHSLHAVGAGDHPAGRAVAGVERILDPAIPRCPLPEEAIERDAFRAGADEGLAGFYFGWLVRL